MAEEETEIYGWSDFFEELAVLSERQYGSANQEFADYIIERLINSCRSSTTTRQQYLSS